MIRVTIELESARTGLKTILGEMCIANDGTVEDDSRGSYDVAVLRKGNTTETCTWPAPTKVTRFGRVEDYSRWSYNVWRLVLRALRSAFPEEK